MRKRFSVSIAISLLISGLALAKLDLSDFDSEAMKNVEDATKELDAAILNKDVEVAVANAEFIRDSLHWAEGYFATKGGVDDAVKWSQQGRDFATAVAKSAAAKDFNAAYDSFGSLKKTCKSCHDAYKPPSI
jgi:hypothetical protein